MKPVHLHEIDKTINFIESNLKEDITSHDILDQTRYSDFHFLRTFQSATGYSLMDYLRKRRLSSAAEELCKKDKRVIDIAGDYYFGYEQTFIKAFKKEFGVTPGSFRRYKINLLVHQKLSLQQMINNKTDNPAVNNRMLLNHGLRLIGIKRKVNYDENSLHSICGRVSDEFHKIWLHKLKDYNNRFVYGYDEKIPNDPANFYTIPCVAVPADTPVPPGMSCVELPFHTSTSNRCFFNKKNTDLENDDYEYIYKNIYNRYLPSLSYEQSQHYDYAITDVTLQTNTFSTFSIHIPIVEKVLAA